MSLIGDIVTSIIQSQVKKAVEGFVTKGEITEAQAPVLVEGIMLEIQIGLDIYNQTQPKEP